MLTRLSEELGSPGGARRVVQAWLDELPGRLQDARECAAGGEMARLREVTHTLKSTCALVDARTAAELAAALERRAAEGEMLQPREVDRLVRVAEHAATVVSAWPQEGEPPGRDA